MGFNLINNLENRITVQTAEVTYSHGQQKGKSSVAQCTPSPSLTILGHELTRVFCPLNSLTPGGQVPTGL